MNMLGFIAAWLGICFAVVVFSFFYSTVLYYSHYIRIDIHTTSLYILLNTPSSSLRESSHVSVVYAEFHPPLSVRLELAIFYIFSIQYDYQV